MPIKPQIIAAISGAVSAYIADEEAACQAAALARSRPPRRPDLRSTSGPWPAASRPCRCGS